VRKAALAVLVAAAVAAGADALKHAIFEADLPWPWAWRVLAVPALAGALAAAVKLVVRWRRGDPVALSAAHARLLFYALLLAMVINFTALQPFEYANLHVALGLGLGAFGAAVAGGGALATRCPRATRILDIAAMNAGLILVGAELVLRVVSVASPSEITALEHTSGARATVGKLVPGRVRWGFPANREGFYDEDVPASRPKHLVVAIGDSFSVGVVPHAWHYTTVAERALPECAIYNMGAWGIGPREYLWLYENRARAHRPDAIVVGLFTGNDMRVGRDGSAILWFDRANLLCWQVPRRLAIVARERRRGALGTRPDETEVVTDRARLVERFPWIEDPMKEEPSSSFETHVTVETEFARVALLRKPEEFKRLFGCLDRIVAAAGDTPLLFVIIPAEHQVEDWLWREVSARLGGGDIDRDRPQKLLVEWCGKKRVPYVDLLPRLRAVEPLADGRRHVYHLHDTHFNARGNRVAGEALAEALRPLLRDAR